MSLATTGCWNESYKKAQPLFLILYHSNCCLFFLSVVETKLLLKTTEHTSHQPQTLSHPPTHTYTHTSSCIHAHAHTHTHSHSLSLSLSFSLSLTHTHTHMHALKTKGTKALQSPPHTTPSNALWLFLSEKNLLMSQQKFFRLQDECIDVPFLFKVRPPLFCSAVEMQNLLSCFNFFKNVYHANHIVLR